MTPNQLWESSYPPPLEPFDGWNDSTYVWENYPRIISGQLTVGLTSQTLLLIGGLIIPAGKPVTAITLLSGATALVGGVNQWFSLIERDTLTPLAVTVDDGATAWAANTIKRLLLSAPLAAASQVRYAYAGVLVNAGTPPNLQGQGSRSGPQSLSPVLNGNSNAGLTNPASLPSPVTAPVPLASCPWVRLDNA